MCELHNRSSCDLKDGVYLFSGTTDPNHMMPSQTNSSHPFHHRSLLPPAGDDANTNKRQFLIILVRTKVKCYGVVNNFFCILLVVCRCVSGKRLCSGCSQPLEKGAAMIIDTLGLFFHMQCFKVL